MKKQRKLFFYIFSFITTVAVSISSTAIAFSSILEENNPLDEAEILTQKEAFDKSNNNQIAESYEKKTAESYVAPSPAPTPTPEPTPTPTPAPEPAQTPTPSPAPVDNAPVFNVTDYIAICDNVNCFTSKDAERGIVQFQSTFFYGHSTIAFNRLKTVYVGNEIIVKDINGVSHRYKITERVIKSKAYLNGDGKVDGFTAGVYAGRYNEIQYSAAFMTCGNGSNNDSNYRLILFAIEI